MRSISSLAVLATSLLVREAVAGRYDVRKRAVYMDIDEVVVTAEVIVTDEGNGVYATGAPVIVGTATIDNTPVLVTGSSSSTSSPPSSTPATTPTTPVAAPLITSSTSKEAAVLIQTTPTSSSSVYVAPKPTTSSAVYVAPHPSTTSTTPVVVATPTTLATVVASKTTSAVTAASTGKRGVAYNDASLTDLFSSSKFSWAYNWGSTSGGTIASNLEYVPMLWGLQTTDTQDWSSIATKAIAAGSTCLLGFNEPDYSGQANLGTAAAAAGWLTYMEPFAGKAKLVSPAVTNGGAPMGLTWLEGFVSACSTCTIDAIAIHWYNGGDATDFQKYIAQAYAAGGNRPVWITEFQAPSSYSAADQATFLSTMIEWLDASDMVERYAYFMAATGNLLDSTTSLSTLGSTYVS